MKITLSIDSKETIELNLADAANIVGWLDDDEKYATFFSLLAEHPTSEVRCVAANKRCVPLKVLKKLARDSSIEVVRTVAANEGAMQQFKVSLIQEMIARDVSVATTIADSLCFFDEALHEDVIQMLLQHDDPKVVHSVLDFERNQLGED
ncbi:MAG: hypothetical protein HOO97_11780 [Sideroxydans sp.]|nr:hypothetical protein [Sideroxydans sp.]